MPLSMNGEEFKVESNLEVLYARVGFWHVKEEAISIKGNIPQQFR